MDALRTALDAFGSYAIEFAQKPWEAGDRLFWPFLLSTLVVAVALYWRRARQSSTLAAYLFPRAVWSHPDAWLDVRYFFFHGLIGHFAIRGVATGAIAFGIACVVSGGAQADLGAAQAVSGARWFLAIAAYLAVAVLADFVSFYMHYLQHKIPVLWQFHKVHHAGEVMHPLSNFREHPIDNFGYALVGGFVQGLAVGVSLRVLGVVPEPVTIAGIAATSALFNMAAYSLRHSHIWLRWPGRWSILFGSPAHHQVHHSRHPDHLDTNFAFMFPVWDVLFGTYVMPDTNTDVEFGIVEDSTDLNSCVNLYIIPFRDAWRVLRGRSKPAPDADYSSEHSLS